MQTTVVINAKIETVSPVNITQHGDRMKGKIPYVVSAGQKFACIPGSTARGTLRRSARAVIDAMKCANGDPKWELKEFYWHTIGGVKASKIDAGNEFKEIASVVPFTLVENIRRRDPLMSVFGTFDPCPMAGRIQIGNAVCSEPILLAGTGPEKQVMNLDERRGNRADDIQRSPGVAEVLSPDALDDWVDMTAGARKAAAMRREIEDLDKDMYQARKELGKDHADVKKIADKIAKLKKERDEHIKATEGSSVNVQQLIEPFESIPAKSELSQRIRLVNANEIEIGLVLAAMRHYSNDNMIGGKRNIGNGEIKTTWSIRDIGAGKTAEVQASLDDGFVIVKGKEYVESMIAAWESFAMSGEMKTHYPTKDEMKVSV